MAESVISEVISSILMNLGSGAYKKLMFAKDLDSHIKRLQEMKSTVEATLLDASIESCTHAQQDVLDKLRAALEDLDYFLDEYEAREDRKKVMSGNKFIKAVRLFFSESNQLVASLSHAHKLKDIIEQFNEIARNHDQFGSITSIPSTNQRRASCVLTTRSQVLTHLVVGRDKDRDNIVSLLSEDSSASEPLSVHTIVGIGGLGKTTLAWYVYTDERLKSFFEVQFWASVDQNFDLTKVLECIVSYGPYGGEENPPIGNMDQLYHLFVRAIRGKKFLLVLDNIWDQDGLRKKWLDLRSLLALGANRSQVLVTTRDKKVAELMASVTPYKLGELTEGDSWHLFQQIAFTQWQEPGVEAIGKQIAAMCPKIPLVIWSIAGHLAEKRTIKEWQALRDDQLANFTSYGRDIMQTLKLSYDRLDERLKCCVTYFALFPKDYIFCQDEVIQLWMALGYIKPHYRNQSLEDVGEAYLTSLFNRGFLEVIPPIPRYGLVRTRFKVYDLMHDLIVCASGYKYKTADMRTMEFDERVRHLSFIVEPTTEHLDWYVPSSIFKLRSLQSIFLQYSAYQCPVRWLRVIPWLSLLSRLTIGFPSLRVLDLKGLGIKELPRSLGGLIHLRYIDLSCNTICKLPSSLTRLENLLVLNLSNCEELQVLPTDISKLKKLRHFKLKYCKGLTCMPMGLGKLTDLQTLSMFVAGEQSSLCGANQIVGSLAELECLNNLKDELTIRVLGRSENIASESRAAKLGMKENITSIIVEFKDSTKDDEIVLESLQPNANLKELRIIGYGGERLPSWMMNQLHLRLPNLTYIYLFDCKGCKYLCSFGRLPHLVELRLHCLEDVEYVEGTTASTNDIGDITKSEPMFPRLHTLDIVSMPKLKGWRRSSMSSSKDQDLKQLSHQLPNPYFLNCRLLDSEVDQTVELEGLLKVFQEFSSPKFLNCWNCKNLEAIPEMIGNLTSMEDIWLYDCPKLKYLPYQISNLTNLKSLRLHGCSEELNHRCSKQGEYWPYVQHIHYIYITVAK